ncbi:MAG: hypothetical protein AAB318_01440, partial [Planctomycetota bacterium]
FVNYHYLKAVKTDASLKQLLVGDLLVQKILKTINKEPLTVVTKEEIPKTVSESNHGKPSPAMSLDQLKITIAEPATSGVGLESIPVTPPTPAIKTGTTLITKPELSGGITTEEVSRLAFITKVRGPIAQQVTEKKDIVPSLMHGVIQETSIITLQDRQVLPPVSGMAESIHVIKLCEPFIEGSVPIN